MSLPMKSFSSQKKAICWSLLCATGFAWMLLILSHLGVCMHMIMHLRQRQRRHLNNEHDQSITLCTLNDVAKMWLRQAKPLLRCEIDVWAKNEWNGSN